MRKRLDEEGVPKEELREDLVTLTEVLKGNAKTAADLINALKMLPEDEKGLKEELKGLIG